MTKPALEVHAWDPDGDEADAICGVVVYPATIRLSSDPARVTCNACRMTLALHNPDLFGREVGCLACRTEPNELVGTGCPCAHAPCIHQYNSAKKEVETWTETARVYATNEAYYKAMVDKLVPLLDDEVFVADDGSRSDEPLYAKVPELIDRLGRSLVAKLTLVTPLRDSEPERIARSFRPDVRVHAPMPGAVDGAPLCYIGQSATEFCSSKPEDVPEDVTCYACLRLLVVQLQEKLAGANALLKLTIEERDEARAKAKFATAKRDDVWFWETGWDSNDPSTLGDQTPVVMSGETLRGLLAKDEEIAKEYAKRRVYGTIAARYQQALQKIRSIAIAPDAHVAAIAIEAKEALAWRHSENHGVPMNDIVEANHMFDVADALPYVPFKVGAFVRLPRFPLTNSTSESTCQVGSGMVVSVERYSMCGSLVIDQDGARWIPDLSCGEVELVVQCDSRGLFSPGTFISEMNAKLAKGEIVNWMDPLVKRRVEEF